MKAFNDKEVLEILLQLRLQPFLLTIWGSMGAMKAEDMKLREVEQDLRTILQFHNLLMSKDIKVPREVIMHMLDKVKWMFRALDPSKEGPLK